MIIIIALIIFYLAGGFYWLNKLGNENAIWSPLQAIVVLSLWPITWFLYNK